MPAGSAADLPSSRPPDLASHIVRGKYGIVDVPVATFSTSSPLSLLVISNLTPLVKGGLPVLGGASSRLGSRVVTTQVPANAVSPQSIATL